MSFMFNSKWAPWIALSYGIAFMLLGTGLLVRSYCLKLPFGIGSILCILLGVGCIILAVREFRKNHK